MSTRQINSVLQQIRRLAEGREARPWTDRQLLDRFINEKEEVAFTALVRRHGPMVMALGWRILRDREDAEDIFQAAFLVLARKARSIRKQESIGGWLYRVAFRLALRVRAKAAKRRGPSLTRPDASPADLLSEISWREVCTALDEELARLPDRCRAPLVLCYLEGKTQDEAQHLLGWSKSSFRRRLEEGRTKLHRRLTRRGITLSAGLWATLLTSQEASAAVLSALARSTVQLAIPFAAGELPAAASPHVILFAKEAVKTAVIHKMKWGAILGIVTAITTGMGLAAHQALTANHAPGQPGELVALADEEGDQAKPEKAKQARLDLYGDPLPEGALRRLGTMRFRHGNGASVAFAADGKTLLTCGGDWTIRTWDPVSGQLLREQKFPPGSSTNPAYILSPDGRLLAFPEHDARGFVCLWNLWDVERNQLRHKFSLDEGWSNEAIFSPDSKTLITAQKNGDILRVWDVVTGQSRILGQHKREVRTFSFAADGTLMTMSKNGTIRFWDLANAREGAQWTAPENVVGAVLSPDGRTVATWSWHDLDKDKGVEFWDAATGEPKKGWIPPNLKTVRAVRFTPEGKEILVSTGQGVTIWDPAAGKGRYTIAGPQGKEIAFSADSRTVAALGALDAGDVNFRHGSVFFVWDLASGKSRAPNATEHGHLGQVDSISFSPDGKTIASSSQHDRTIRLWETDSGRLLWTIPISDPLSFHSLTFTPNGKNVLHGTSAAIVRWDVSSRQETSRIPLYEDGKEDPQHLQRMHLTEDGDTLLAVSQNLHSKHIVGGGYTGSSNAFQAWNLSTGGRLRLTSLDADHILFAYGSFSPDGRLLVAPSGSIFDTASGKEVLKLSVEGMSLGPVAISRDGAYVAQSAFKMVKGPDFQPTENIGVQIWELATLLPVARLETGPLAHVAFTPDNRRLITAGPDALKLWDISSAKVMTRRNAPARFRGSYGNSFVSSMALAPDGNTVATGHVDSTILLWDLVPPSQHRPVPQLRPDQLTSFWSDLASTDASRAFVAITRLAEVPEQTVGLLRDRLRPVSPPTPEDLGRLIAGLNNPDFTRREAATKQLTELGDLASGALRKALNQSQPLEARRRIEALLASPPAVLTNEARRDLRAIRVLERIGTPEAKQALETLTHGAAESKITQEAKGALDRLTKRPSVSP